MDDSRNRAAEEQQQLGPVARVERESRPLAKRENPARQRRVAVDPDQRLGADQIAGRTKQRMAALDGAHFDGSKLGKLARQERGFDRLDAVAVGAKALVADDQPDGDRVDAQDQRPFLGDDVKLGLNRIRLHRGEHRGVD